MLINDQDKLSSILRITADTLDIPDFAYENAVLKYEDVGEHLGAEDSELKTANPQIYPQGSFRLGTVVQPINRSDEYDIDLVCQLEIDKENISQKDLKAKVGNRLKARQDLAEILEPSRRCWTLNYPPNDGMPRFHMDVLPSIPNQERPPTGILLTDTELTRWQKSNPKSYADWFWKRMLIVFSKRKATLAKSMEVNVEDVPDWRVKTPLQRSIQILKRHRDIYFQNNPDNRPVSIILTTLAAHAYKNQDDIFDALLAITKGMPNYIEYKNGKWRVDNPVDPDENFADKWNEYPERRDAFMLWLQKVESDFSNFARADNLYNGLIALEKSLGLQTMQKVGSKLGLIDPRYLPAISSSQPFVPTLGSTYHAEEPQWPVIPMYNIRLSGGVYFKRKNKQGRYLWPLGEKSVPKRVWIRFVAHTDVPEPYSIRWQVVNTGKEAFDAEQPRGDFYDSDGADKNIRWESTSYRGTHWVEAFAIKEGVCVARSGRKYVKVRGLW